MSAKCKCGHSKSSHLKHGCVCLEGLEKTLTGWCDCVKYRPARSHPKEEAMSAKVKPKSNVCVCGEERSQHIHYPKTESDLGGFYPEWWGGIQSGMCKKYRRAKRGRKG
jgi:hypothetical protein